MMEYKTKRIVFDGDIYYPEKGIPPHFGIICHDQEIPPYWLPRTVVKGIEDEGQPETVRQFYGDKFSFIEDIQEFSYANLILGRYGVMHKEDLTQEQFEETHPIWVDLYNDKKVITNRDGLNTGGIDCIYGGGDHYIGRMELTTAGNIIWVLDNWKRYQLGGEDYLRVKCINASAPMPLIETVNGYSQPWLVHQFTIATPFHAPDNDGYRVDPFPHGIVAGRPWGPTFIPFMAKATDYTYIPAARVRPIPRWYTEFPSAYWYPFGETS